MTTSRYDGAALRAKAERDMWMPYSPPGAQGSAFDEMRVLSGGKGSWLWDPDGRRYLDGVSALEAAILGHGDEEVIEAIDRQLRELSFLDVCRFSAPSQVELAERLTSVAPGMQYVHFTPGGAEADEVAIKLARQYHHLRGQPYRTKVLTRHGSFHGVTMGAMTLGRYFASSNDVYEGGVTLGRTVPVQRPYPDDLGKAGRHLPSVDAIEATIVAEEPETVAAVVVDPIATAIAVGAPPDSYQRELRAVCDRYGVLLVCDEVLTGMGRTGRVFATEFSGIEPDFMTVSKGLSSGYVPIAACMAAPHVAETLKEHRAVFKHGHTYAGHPVGAAAALAVLDRLERDRLWERAAAMGERLMAGLQTLSDNPLYWDVRGRGLIAGLEIVADGATGEDFADLGAAGNELRCRCRDHGLVSIVLHPGNVLFLAPALTVSEEEVDAMVEIVRTALGEMAEARS